MNYFFNPGIFSTLLLYFFVLTLAFDQEKDWKDAKSIYEFVANDIDGTSLSLNKFEGKVLIITNVASKCGLTKKNYEELQELYDKYKDQGLEILAFPCNQFNNQEPGSNAEIKEFAKERNATFTMMDKIDVNGEKAHPLFKYLKSVTENNKDIEWNFAKFLIGKDGKVIKRYNPKDNPKDMENDVKNALQK